MALLKFVSLGLVFTIVGCAYQLGQIKKDPVQTEPTQVVSTPQAPSAPGQRSPADDAEQEKTKAELLRLQEENAKLRAQLIELQQKLATLPGKKEKKEKVKVTAAPAPAPVSRKPSKAQKVAGVKKHKKPKVIQISFEEGEKDPSKN